MTDEIFAKLNQIIYIISDDRPEERVKVEEVGNIIQLDAITQAEVTKVLAVIPVQDSTLRQVLVQYTII